MKTREFKTRYGDVFFFQPSPKTFLHGKPWKSDTGLMWAYSCMKWVYRKVDVFQKLYWVNGLSTFKNTLLTTYSSYCSHPIKVFFKGCSYDDAFRRPIHLHLSKVKSKTLVINQQKTLSIIVNHILKQTQFNIHHYTW